MAIDISLTWAFGSEPHPALADVMVPRLLAAQEWSALNHLSNTGLLRPEHLADLDVDLDLVKDLLVTASRGPLLDLVNDALTKLTLTEVAALLSSWRLEGDRRAQDLLDRLPAPGQLNVIKNATSALLSSVEWSRAAPGFRIHSQVSKPLRKELDLDSTESRAFLRLLDLGSFLNVAELIFWPSHVQEIMVARFVSGDLDRVDQYAGTRALSVLTRLLIPSVLGVVIPLGSPLLDAWDTLAARLESFNDPTITGFVEQERVAVLQYHFCRAADWEEKALPTRSRLLEVALAGRATTLAARYALAHEDEELRAACLAAPHLAPEVAADLALPGTVERLLDGRDPQWVAHFVSQVALDALGSTDSLVAECITHLGLDAVLVAIGAGDGLDASGTTELIEAVEAVPGHDPDLRRRLVARTVVSTMDADFANDFLLPHVLAEAGASPAAWEVLATLVSTFAGTVEELTAACTELV